MPSLANKRGRTRWVGRVQVNGEIRTKTFPDDSRKSEKAAISWEDEKRKELLAKVNEIPSDFVTVLDWATKYLEHSRGAHSQKVFEEKRAVLSRLLRSGLVKPDDLVESISPGVALRHLEAQRDAVLMVKKKGKLVLRPTARGGNAANKDRKNLAAAWKWGRTFIDGFPLVANPWRIAPKMRADQHPRYVPPLEDFWKVVNMLGASEDIADNQDRVLLLAMLHTAGRRNELFGLQRCDLTNHQIRLWTRKREGGNREENWIPLTPVLRDELAGWLKIRPIESEYVFVCLRCIMPNNYLYGQPFKVRQRFMAKACERAGVKPFGFHAIRHLSASVLWNEGIDIKDIQLILRHKSQATTERYLHRLGLLQPTGQRIGEALEKGGKVIEFPVSRAVGE